MEKIFTIVGTIFLVLGLLQGMSLGVAEEPLLDGIIGGAFPVFAGALGSFLISLKGFGEGYFTGQERNAGSAPFVWQEKLKIK